MFSKTVSTRNIYYWHINDDYETLCQKRNYFYLGFLTSYKRSCKSIFILTCPIPTIGTWDKYNSLWWSFSGPITATLNDQINQNGTQMCLLYWVPQHSLINRCFSHYSLFKIKWQFLHDLNGSQILIKLNVRKVNFVH